MWFLSGVGPVATVEESVENFPPQDDGALPCVNAKWGLVWSSHAIMGGIELLASSQILK